MLEARLLQRGHGLQGGIADLERSKWGEDAGILSHAAGVAKLRDEVLMGKSGMSLSGFHHLSNADQAAEP